MSIETPQHLGDHAARIETLANFKVLAKQGGLDDSNFESFYNMERQASAQAIAAGLKAASATAPVIGVSPSGALYAPGGPEGFAVVVPTPLALIGLDGAVSQGGTPVPANPPAPVPNPVPGGTTPPAPTGEVPPSSSGSESGTPLPESSGTPATGDDRPHSAGVDAAGNPLPQANS